MQPLVQSALDAANRGENNKALEFCKQALAADPNDVDAWLVIAAVVEQPERKRQCLNRVLALDPTNQIAREELLEMDRAALGGGSPSGPEPVTDTYESAPISEPVIQPPGKLATFQPVPIPEDQIVFSTADDTASAETLEPAPTPPPSEAALGPSPQRPSEKKLVFQFPLVYRLLMYCFPVIFGCGGLLIATQELLAGLFFIAIALVVGSTAIVFSPKVEVSEMGIRTSTILSSSMIKWDEIKSMKSGWMKQTLELLNSRGEVVKVSTQLSGYSRILHILRKKRPDLFGRAASTAQSNPPEQQI